MQSKKKCLDTLSIWAPGLLLSSLQYWHLSRAKTNVSGLFDFRNLVPSVTRKEYEFSILDRFQKRFTIPCMNYILFFFVRSRDSGCNLHTDILVDDPEAALRGETVETNFKLSKQYIMRWHYRLVNYIYTASIITWWHDMDNGLLHQEPLATVASVGEYYFGGRRAQNVTPCHMRKNKTRPDETGPCEGPSVVGESWVSTNLGGGLTSLCLAKKLSSEEKMDGWIDEESRVRSVQTHFLFPGYSSDSRTSFYNQTGVRWQTDDVRFSISFYLLWRKKLTASNGLVICLLILILVWSIHELKKKKKKKNIYTEIQRGMELIYGLVRGSILRLIPWISFSVPFLLVTRKLDQHHSSEYTTNVTDKG